MAEAVGGLQTSTLLPLMSPHLMDPEGSMWSICSVFLLVVVAVFPSGRGLQMISIFFNRHSFLNGLDTQVQSI